MGAIEALLGLGEALNCVKAIMAATEHAELKAGPAELDDTISREDNLSERFFLK
jgi:hypothetical protein